MYPYAQAICCNGGHDSMMTGKSANVSGTPGRRAKAWSAVGMAALLTTLAGCGASLPGFSTSAVNKAPPDNNTPTNRAFTVGATAARATKCGYNFDPVKLRTQFLASEAATDPAGTESVGRAYDTAFNGVTKAIAGQGEGYCSRQKLATIKDSLTRHLAGDYTPPPPAPVEEDGLFGSLNSSNSGDSEYAKKMQANPTLEH